MIYELLYGAASAAAFSAVWLLSFRVWAGAVLAFGRALSWLRRLA